ncbi:hypothetical protein BH23ACT4_BH23ACT4_09810 [soil metagenome]
MAASPATKLMVNKVAANSRHLSFILTLTLTLGLFRTPREPYPQERGYAMAQ